MNNIKELQESLKDILKNDPEEFAEKIDQFDPNTAINNLSNYWNSSIKDFYDKLKEIIPSIDWDNTNNNGHNAGYSFSNSPYVNPNVNKNNENYDEVRGNDKISSVLKNKDHLDYTIWNNEKEEIATEIKKYMTRLLMPQYQRRVEIEDLNRDFWVIGQNLTALNEVILRIGDEFINQFIAELCGLWDNIYRLWQVLFYIEDSIRTMASGEKIRIMMEYGYGELEDTTNKSGIVFTKNNAYKYGILPYISKEIIDGKHIAFVQYNKRLWNLSNDNIDLLNEYTGNSSLIKIEQKTNRNLLEIFNYIKSKNFVLFAQGTENCFSSIVSAENPIATVLDFYRDFIVLVSNADKGNNLSTTIKDTSVWKQAGYLKNIDFKSGNSATSISENVRSSFQIIKELIKINRSFDVNIFCNKVINCDSTAISALIDSITVSFDTLIKDFYNLFKDCQNLIGFTSYDDDPNFNNADLENNNNYTVPSYSNLIQSFINKISEYNKKNAIEKDSIFRMFTEGSLPIVVWDLLSMSDSTDTIEKITDKSFGYDYFCSYTGSVDHLWIDFVANIQTDSYNLSKANEELKIGEKSTIGSITINDLMNDEKWQANDTVYDVNISVPINKRTATASDKNNELLAKYHDFIRINRPYPNVTKIEPNMRTVKNSAKNEDALGAWNDLRHLHDLNDNKNWIGQVQEGTNSYYCVDGFYSFNNSEYSYLTINDNTTIDNVVSENPRILKNLLTYQISTSDMISCEHDEQGQSRIINKINFEDPVVNLRFINGKFEGQEIEIITTKDKTIIPKKKIDLNLELEYIELTDKDEQGIGVDFFAYIDDDEVVKYINRGEQGDIGRNIKDIYAAYHTGKYYRQGVSIGKKVNAGGQITIESDSSETFGDCFPLLSLDEAKKAANNRYDLNNKNNIQSFLVTKRIRNHLRSDMGDGFNEAGLYIGYVMIYIPNNSDIIPTPIVIPVEKVVTPILTCSNKETSKKQEVGNLPWYYAPRVVFMRDTIEGTFGHLHSYFYGNGKNGWLLTAYGLLTEYEYNDIDDYNFSIDIIFPDLIKGEDSGLTDVHTELLDKYNTWEKAKNAGKQVFLVLSADVKRNNQRNSVIVNPYWHGSSKVKEYFKGTYDLADGQQSNIN